MRVVIKVGTSLIAPGGQIDANLLRGLVDQFDLGKNEYLIVTSGAIAAGIASLGLTKRPGDVPAMQACAAVGQSRLMHTYERLFFGKKVVAQLLLSSDDFTSPVRYRNLQNALAELLSLGVVPIVNENDSVLLTDVDGFLVPNRSKKPRLVRVVRKLTAALEAQCNGKSKLGRGGMISKLKAAKLASEAGVHVAIVNGRYPAGIKLGMERKIGTYFPPSSPPNSAPRPVAPHIPRHAPSHREKH
jgi:glutamate 5-kinase